MKAFSNWNVRLLVETHPTNLTSDTASMYNSLTDKLVWTSILVSLSDVKTVMDVFSGGMCH